MSATQALAKVLNKTTRSEIVRGVIPRKMRQVVKPPTGSEYLQQLLPAQKEMVQEYMPSHFQDNVDIAGKHQGRGKPQRELETQFENAYNNQQVPNVGYAYFLASIGTFGLHEYAMELVRHIEKAAMTGDREKLAQAIVRYGKLVQPGFRNFGDRVAVFLQKHTGRAHTDLARSMQAGYEPLLQTEMMQQIFTAIDNTIHLVDEVVLKQYPQLRKQAEALHKQAEHMPSDLKLAYNNLAQRGDALVAAKQDNLWAKHTAAHQGSCPDCMVGLDVVTPGIEREIGNRSDQAQRDYMDAQAKLRALQATYAAKQRIADNAAAVAMRAPDELLADATEQVVYNITSALDINTVVLDRWRQVQTGTTNPATIIVPRQLAKARKRETAEMKRAIKGRNPMLITTRN